MTESYEAEFAAVGEVVKAAGLEEDSERVALWCAKQLPALYETFSTSYDTRIGEEITRLQLAILGQVPPAQKQELLTRWRSFHEGMGLPGLDPRLEPRPRARKKAS